MTESAEIVATLRTAGCVYAEDEAGLLIASARTPDELASMIARRVAGLPLEHVVGWAEFCGLRIAVDPGVFVPRRRTEFLAQQAVSLARQAVSLAGDAKPPAGDAEPPAGQSESRGRSGAVVVDLCCGSGALGAVLLAQVDQIELHAADIEAAAVHCARRNIENGQVYQGDLFDALPPDLRGRVAVVVANVPYVPTGEIELLPPEARRYEPHVTLDGGRDGLAVLRRIAAAAPHWLAPGGHLLIETSDRQSSDAVEVFVRSGLTARVADDDDLGATVVIGTQPLIAEG